MDGYVLTVDCGTQSVRALVFDTAGQLLAKAKIPVDPYEPSYPGWAEQDPQVYWNALCESVKQLYEESPDVFSRIRAIALTTQRDTCVLVDEAGKPLRKAIVWMDQRLLDKPLPMSLPYDLATGLVGMHRTAVMVNRACKAHWIKVHEPNIWKKTYRYLLLSGYLNYRLTGKFIDSIGSQIGHIPFNYKKGEWEGPLGLKRQFFQIEREKLCDLASVGSSLGGLTEEAAAATGLPAGLPVIAAASDKGCETLGVGCLSDSTASISFGSQASVQTMARRYYESEQFMPPFPAAIPGRYNPEIQIYRGFWMISWFKEQFAQKEMAEAARLGVAPEDLLNERLREIPPGCDGLVLQPYWGAGVKNPEARGAIIGFSDVHTRIHIYRAIIEGIGLALRGGIQQIERKSRTPIERIMISGGGSQSDEILQIAADVFNKPVCRVQTYETSGLGAAIIGYVALGAFSGYEEAVSAMVHPTDRFEPRPENARIYDGLYQDVYSKLYRKMKPLYLRINQYQQP
jgi:sugar (pentulose or hexulose) kinase